MVRTIEPFLLPTRLMMVRLITSLLKVVYNKFFYDSIIKTNISNHIVFSLIVL